MDATLPGKVGVVTGGASGIGLAIVLKFLEPGAAGVVAVGRAADPPEALRRQMQTNRLRYVQGDVSLEQTAREFVRVALEAFGGLDVMVNNAGISVVKALHEHTPAEWDAVMNTNVKAAYWAARHVMPVMMKQKSGVIL